MKLWLIAGGLLLAAVALAFVILGRETPPPPAKVEVPMAASSDKTDWPAAQAAFLAENAKREGWKVTDSGIQYTVLKAADASAPKPTPGTEVTVHYEGRLIDGKVFDSSYARNEPTSFPLSGVIRGWQEGVAMMRVGETWEFAIPSNLAYGDRGTGPIPGGSVLIFKIELLSAAQPLK